MRGGPFFRLARRLGLTRGGAFGITARTVIALGIAFVPLVVLAALQSVLASDRVKLPLLDDLTVYARFLLAIPLLIQVEAFIDRRLQWGVTQFRTSDLLDTPRGRSEFETAVERLERERDAWLPEIVLVVAAFTFAWFNNRSIPTPVSSWWMITPGDASTITWAGRWLGLVSMPLFTFLILRWLWRMLIWSRFLHRVSRVDLRLVPTHPDGAGGLSFLGAVQATLGAFLIPISASVAARGVQWVQLGDGTLESLRNALILFVAIALAIVLAPLQVFVGKLVVAKRNGLLDYARLATDYTRAFDRKWVRDPRPADEPLLGTADIQSLADLGNSYAFIRNMRITPLHRQHALALLLTATIPMLPFLLAIIPMEEMLKQVAQLLVR
jgi:hypothetical protein